MLGWQSILVKPSRGVAQIDMKTILLLDTETTGTDERAVCIEVAVALYSVEYAAVVRSYSSLIRHDANEAEAP
jgi:hypothetical protein